jgi:hypothetical protein
MKKIYFDESINFFVLNSLNNYIFLDKIILSISKIPFYNIFLINKIPKEAFPF